MMTKTGTVKQTKEIKKLSRQEVNGFEKSAELKEKRLKTAKAKKEFQDVND